MASDAEAAPAVARLLAAHARQKAAGVPSPGPDAMDPNTWATYLAGGGASAADLTALRDQSTRVFMNFYLTLYPLRDEHGVLFSESPSVMPGAGVVQDVIGGAASAVTDISSAVVTLVRELLDPGNWKRLGLILGGAVVAILGVYLIGRDLIPSPADLAATPPSGAPAA